MSISPDLNSKLKVQRSLAPYISEETYVQYRKLYILSACLRVTPKSISIKHTIPNFPDASGVFNLKHINNVNSYFKSGGRRGARSRVP